MRHFFRRTPFLREAFGLAPTVDDISSSGTRTLRQVLPDITALYKQCDTKTHSERAPRGTVNQVQALLAATVIPFTTPVHYEQVVLLLRQLNYFGLLHGGEFSLMMGEWLAYKWSDLPLCGQLSILDTVIACSPLNGAPHSTAPSALQRARNTPGMRVNQFDLGSMETFNIFLLRCVAEPFVRTIHMLQSPSQIVTVVRFITRSVVNPDDQHLTNEKISDIYRAICSKVRDIFSLGPLQDLRHRGSANKSLSGADISYRTECLLDIYNEAHATDGADRSLRDVVRELIPPHLKFIGACETYKASPLLHRLILSKFEESDFFSALCEGLEELMWVHINKVAPPFIEETLTMEARLELLAEAIALEADLSPFMTSERRNSYHTACEHTLRFMLTPSLDARTVPSEHASAEDAANIHTVLLVLSKCVPKCPWILNVKSPGNLSSVMNKKRQKRKGMKQLKKKLNRHSVQAGKYGTDSEVQRNDENRVQRLLFSIQKLKQDGAAIPFTFIPRAIQALRPLSNFPAEQIHILRLILLHPLHSISYSSATSLLSTLRSSYGESATKLKDLISRSHLVDLLSTFLTQDSTSKNEVCIKTENHENSSDNTKSELPRDVSLEDHSRRTELACHSTPETDLLNKRTKSDDLILALACAIELGLDTLPQYADQSHLTRSLSIHGLTRTVMEYKIQSADVSDCIVVLRFFAKHQFSESRSVYHPLCDRISTLRNELTLRSILEILIILKEKKLKYDRFMGILVSSAMSLCRSSSTEQDVIPMRSGATKNRTLRPACSSVDESELIFDLVQTFVNMGLRHIPLMDCLVQSCSASRFPDCVVQLSKVEIFHTVSLEKMARGHIKEHLKAISSIKKDSEDYLAMWLRCLNTLMKSSSLVPLVLRQFYPCFIKKASADFSSSYMSLGTNVALCALILQYPEDKNMSASEPQVRGGGSKQNKHVSEKSSPLPMHDSAMLLHDCLTNSLKSLGILELVHCTDYDVLVRSVLASPKLLHSLESINLNDLYVCMHKSAQRIKLSTQNPGRENLCKGSLLQQFRIFLIALSVRFTDAVDAYPLHMTLHVLSCVSKLDCIQLTNITGAAGRMIQKKDSELDVSLCCLALSEFARLQLFDDRVLRVLFDTVHRLRHQHELTSEQRDIVETASKTFSWNVAAAASLPSGQLDPKPYRNPFYGAKSP